MSADALIDRLQGVQGKGPRWRSICPAHPSKHGTRSLSIFEAEDGRTLVHCHAGCDLESVVSAVGLELGDLFPSNPIGDHQPRIRKPWRVREVIAALKGELMVSLVVLSDVRAGKPLSDVDRERAGVALERITLFLSELEDAQ